MNNLELAEKLKKVATDHKTLYVMGCFGAPLTGANVNRYCTNHSYNKAADRTAMIKAAANQNPPVFGFDCVCLIKGILWGWDGTASATYGGAKYTSNGVPDINADQMITRCSGVSTDFSNIEIGEAVWMPGHIGIYIGNGLAVECTPRWKNKTQITAVLNIGAKAGYNGRQWTKHGKLPYITYVAGQDKPSPSTTFKVGDLVQFTGGKIYSSSNATIAAVSKRTSRCKITQIYNGKHPYHLISEDGKGVYGWVDGADFAAIGSPIPVPPLPPEKPVGDKFGPSAVQQTVIKVGGKVKVLKAQTYNGGTFKTYYSVYDVIQVKGDRIVIGIGKIVIAAIKASNLQPV